jgi:hypothetical protein
VVGKAGLPVGPERGEIPVSDLDQQPDRPMPPRANCCRYRPGHTLDLIRVRLAQMSPAEDWHRVVVLDVQGDQLTLGTGDELAGYRTHDAALLASLLADHGAIAMLNAEHHLLFLPPRADGSSPIFSVQSADEPAEPCSMEPTAQ